jgi:hypothetical protein
LLDKSLSQVVPGEHPGRITKDVWLAGVLAVAFAVFYILAQSWAQELLVLYRHTIHSDFRCMFSFWLAGGAQVGFQREVWSRPFGPVSCGLPLGFWEILFGESMRLFSMWMFLILP